MKLAETGDKDGDDARKKGEERKEGKKVRRYEKKKGEKVG